MSWHGAAVYHPGLAMNTRTPPVLAALLLVACATTTPGGATANELAQSERIGRLEAERNEAAELVKVERAARVEAEVKAARLAYEVAVGEYNILMTEAVCDRSRGLTIDAATETKIKAAFGRMEALTAGCGRDEPGDLCVERKAREAER